MREWSLLCILLISLSSFSSEEKSPFKIIVLDDDIDKSKIPSHQVEKFQISTKLPSLQKRNSDFVKAGITENELEGDELDKDVLWIKAKNGSLIELEKKYPKISKDKLIKLIEVVKK